MALNQTIPLSVRFSSSVSTAAPYMSLKQIQYLLSSRSESDWQPRDLRRLKYISSVKKKVRAVCVFL